MPPDAASLAHNHPALDVTQLHADIAGLIALGGFAWVIGPADEPQRLMGYATVAPVPGLPGVGDLDCWIAPARRRQGWGSHLLRAVLAGLQTTDYTQVTHAVTHLAEPKALFLRAHGFTVEHRECILRLTEVGSVTAVTSPPPGVTLRTFERAAAIANFCHVYDASFQGLPWYQPYTPAEVAGTLWQARDLLFLTRDDEMLGVAWLRREGHLGMVEPIGIVRVAWGQGYGRYLLHAALHHLIQRDTAVLQIGAWCDNTPALQLYRSFGFQRHSTLTYLTHSV